MEELQRLEEAMKRAASEHQEYLRRFSVFMTELREEMARQETASGQTTTVTVTDEWKTIVHVEAYDDQPAETSEWGWLVKVNVATPFGKTGVEVEVEQRGVGLYDIIDRYGDARNAGVRSGKDAAQMLLGWTVRRINEIANDLSGRSIRGRRDQAEFVN